MTQQLDTFGLWANIVSGGVSGGGYGQRVAFGTDNDVITAKYLDWWGSSYSAQKSPVVDSTDEALAHYFEGSGESVELGPDTKNALRNHPLVQRQSEALRVSGN